MNATLPFFRQRSSAFIGGSLLAFLICFSAASEEPAAPELSAADKEKLTALIAQLGHEDFDIREKAERTLRTADARIVPLLREAQKASDDIETARRIKRLLSRQEVKIVIDTLIAKYKEDPDKLFIEARQSAQAKPPDESLAMLWLAAAIFRRKAASLTEDLQAQRRAQAMASACEMQASNIVMKKTFPSGQKESTLDEKDIKRLIQERLEAEPPKEKLSAPQAQPVKKPQGEEE